MSDQSKTPAGAKTAAASAEAEFAEQRRQLMKRLAAGSFGAPAVLASLATKAAAAS